MNQSTGNTSPAATAAPLVHYGDARDPSLRCSRCPETWHMPTSVRTDQSALEFWVSQAQKAHWDVDATGGDHLCPGCVAELHADNEEDPSDVPF